MSINTTYNKSIFLHGYNSECVNTINNWAIVELDTDSMLFIKRRITFFPTKEEALIFFSTDFMQKNNMFKTEFVEVSEYDYDYKTDEYFSKLCMKYNGKLVSTDYYSIEQVATRLSNAEEVYLNDYVLLTDRVVCTDCENGLIFDRKWNTKDNERMHLFSDLKNNFENFVANL